MKLPSELVVATRIRQQRKILRRRGRIPPALTGAYDVASRDRRQTELAAIVAAM